MSNVAIKHDDEKVRLDLLSPIALNEIAKVLTFGAKKYADHNWRKGFKWSRLLGASMRHILAFLGGEDKDPETGLSHLAHAGCCIIFLLEHESTHKDKDDRYKGTTPEPVEQQPKIFIPESSGVDIGKPISHLTQGTCEHRSVSYSFDPSRYHVIKETCKSCSKSLFDINAVDKSKKPAYF